MIEISFAGLSNETWALLNIGLGCLVAFAGAAVLYCVPKREKEER